MRPLHQSAGAALMPPWDQPVPHPGAHECAPYISRRGGIDAALGQPISHPGAHKCAPYISVGAAFMPPWGQPVPHPGAHKCAPYISPQGRHSCRPGASRSRIQGRINAPPTFPVGAALMPPWGQPVPHPGAHECAPYISPQGRH